jgi:hypothetical protein
LQLFQFFPAKAAFNGPGPQDLEIRFLSGEEQRHLTSAFDLAHKDRANRPSAGVDERVIIGGKAKRKHNTLLEVKVLCLSVQLFLDASNGSFALFCAGVRKPTIEKAPIDNQPINLA